MISSQEKVMNALDTPKLHMPKVDFRAYLRNREEAEQAVRSAGDFRGQLHDRVLGKYAAMGATLPWEFTHDKFRLREGEVTLWFGQNGHKKSMVTGQVAAYLMAQDHKVAIASLEMAPAATLGRMMPQAHGTHCHTTQQADDFLSWCDSRLWVYDRRGVVRADAILGAIYYCSEQLGVTHFFVDSLMKCVKSEEDYDGQKSFVDSLCAAALELKIHIHLIHHARKISDPKQMPGKADAKGSGSITDQVDNVVVVFQIPEDGKAGDSPDHCLSFVKQRNATNGWEGKLVTWFDKDSLQFLNRRGEKSKCYITF